MNILKYILSFLLLALFIKLKATNGNDVLGSRSMAMGGFSTTLSDVWSTNNNQAGLGYLDNISGGIYYESRFMLKETAFKAGTFALPTKLGAFGLSVTSFGYSLYNETKAGISYGQKLGEKIALGVQMNYLNVKLNQDYGQKSTLTAAVGLIARLTQELTMGVHVYNPTRVKLADYNNERIPTIMKLGLDYKFSEKVFLALETEKDMNYGAIAKVGLEYIPIDILYLRGGISTHPTMSSFGFGVKLKDFKLDLSSSFHQTLGLTPSISLIYTGGK